MISMHNLVAHNAEFNTSAACYMFIRQNRLEEEQGQKERHVLHLGEGGGLIGVGEGRVSTVGVEEEAGSVGSRGIKFKIRM